MTEKTTKTPHPDQNSDVSKDQTTVSGAKDGIKQDDKPVDVSRNKAAAKDPGTSTAQKPAQTPAGSVGAKNDAATKNNAAAKNAPVAKSDSSADKAAAPATTAGGGSGGKNTPPPASSDVPPKKSSSLPIVVIGVVVILLAAGLAYQYSSSRQQIALLESQSRSSAEQARQAEQKAQQALDALNQQRDTFASLRAELQESRTELDGLNTAFQSITDRGSILVLLNDIDHLVMIAQQQLQLNGNVANAIISLETAQAQLARANRPALASLQQSINGDLDRLRAATTVDIALLSARLDELAGLVSQAPLLIPDGATPVRERPARDSAARSSDGSASGSDSDAWWEKALSGTWEWTSDTVSSVRHELGQFISVRRVDDAAALLISPDQATRFRDSLRQRIMTAQLALMMDQSLIWETETNALLKAIESRFDPESSVTRQAVRVAREVADTAIDTPLPDVNNSIQTLEAMSDQMGRRSVSEQPSNADPQQDEDEGQPNVDAQGAEHAESEAQVQTESLAEPEGQDESDVAEQTADATDNSQPETQAGEQSTVTNNIADESDTVNSADIADDAEPTVEADTAGSADVADPVGTADDAGANATDDDTEANSIADDVEVEQG